MDERLRKELLRSELKERNKGKKIIRCKYRPKYPDSAEREYEISIIPYAIMERSESRLPTSFLASTQKENKSWKLQFSASSSIFIENYYYRVFLIVSNFPSYSIVDLYLFVLSASITD